MTELYGTTQEHATPKLEAALEYARRGVPVFPCKPQGKTPLTPNGYLAATTDQAQIRRWWIRFTDANIATPTGPASGFLVLDVDNFTSLEILENEHGQLPPTASAKTGGGGMHLFFIHPEQGKAIRNSASKLGPGLDIRGDGGYVILPPSATESPYEWLERCPPAEPPTWLIRLLREPNSAPCTQSPTPAAVASTEGERILEGTRNVTLTSIAGRLHDGTRTLEQLLTELMAINEARCLTPLPQPEVRRIAESIYRLKPCRRSSEPPEPEVIKMGEEILAAWWDEAWPGLGGKSERDLELAAIVEALQHGKMMPNGNGILLSISFRQLAERARVGVATAHRAFTRLRSKGWMRGGGNGPNRKSTDAAGIVLLAPRKKEHSQPPNASIPNGVECVPPCAPPTSLRGRHSAPGLRRVATKSRIAAVDYLERAGDWLDEAELAAMLGIKRVRDVRRRYLEPLEAAAVVECSGSKWRLTANWRLALEALFAEDRQIERFHYGKTADERQKERHQKDREDFRVGRKIKPDRAPSYEEMREYRESYPRRRRDAIAAVVVRLFAERPEYKDRRVGQITCALSMFDYLPADFPRGSDGVPKDAEVETVLDGVAA